MWNARVDCILLMNLKKILRIVKMLILFQTFSQMILHYWDYYMRLTKYQAKFIEDIVVDNNEIRAHNHLVCKWTLNYFLWFCYIYVSLAKWLSVHLGTKWLWVWILLLSLKLQIWHLLQTRSSLTFSQTIECRFTLKLVHNMITTYRYCCCLYFLSSINCSM